MSNFKWADITIQCLNCKGVVDVSVMDSEGNAEGECGECGSRIAFHYTVEIDGVYDNTLDE